MSVFTALVLAIIAGAAYMTRRIGGDTQFERPIVLAPIVGLILGDLQTGIVVGGAFELIFIGAAAIGGAVPPNIVLATVIGTSFAIETGGGTKTAFLVGVPAAVVASSFELLAKGGCSFLVHRADKHAQTANGRAITGVVWTGNGLHFVSYAVPAFLALYFGQSAVRALTSALSGPANDGLVAAASLLPAVGFGILLTVLYNRALFPLFFVGFALAAYAGFTVIGVVLLAGAMMLFLYHRARRAEASALQPAGVGAGQAGADTGYDGSSAHPSSAADGDSVMADATAETLVTRRDIRQLFWRSFLLQAAFNYERFQNMGYWWGVKPLLRKLHGRNPTELAAADQRHLQFFNTHPWTCGPIFGITATMEAQRARDPQTTDGESINAVKVSMMGPLAGLGDSLVFGAIRPVMSGLTAALAVSGNIAGPLIFLIGINVIHFAMRWYGLDYGFRYGVRFFERLDPAQIERVKEYATSLGLLVVGALVATLLPITTALTYTSGDATINVQDYLDDILPFMLPLAATLGAFWLARRRVNPTWILLIATVVGLVGGYFGILAGEA
jgi:mannose/fructose/sorbose-specific phosphotransferase system IID component